MSARTPFIPQHNRPASRTAHPKEQSASTLPNSARDSDNQFTPDHSNPLHSAKSPPIPLPTSKNNASSSSEHGSSSSIAAPKPLNINGLFKKPVGPNHGGLTMSSRKSSKNQQENSPAAPETSTNLSALTKSRSIRRDQAGTPVVAPKPLLAPSASGLLNSSSFKTPSIPASSASTLHVSSEAHIAINDTQEPVPMGDGPAPNDYKFGNAPPQRVLLHDNPLSAVTSMTGFMTKHRDRGAKRGRAELEADDDIVDPEMMYGNRMGAGPMKRYKAQAPMQMGMNNGYMEEEIDCLSRPSFSPQPISSPVERPESRHSRHSDYQHASPSEYHTSPNQGFQQQQSHQRMAQEGGERRGDMGPPGVSHDTQSNTSAEGGTVGDALDKLLGCQADAYIEDHMDKYEQLTAKWRECSIDEWRKGADEIMAKYMNIFDFVKNHMATKLKLFTTFDEQVEGHNVTLGERAKVLEGVKAKLVSQSGSILG